MSWKPEVIKATNDARGNLWRAIRRAFGHYHNGSHDERELKLLMDEIERYVDAKIEERLRK